jgi:hypothetical protein
LRFKIEANVLTDGNATRGLAAASTARSFFGPQVGRCRRAAMIALFSHGSTAWGEVVE